MGKAKIKMLDRININPDYINSKYNNWIGHEGTITIFLSDIPNGSYAVFKFGEGKAFSTSAIQDITFEDGILKLETLNTVYVLEILEYGNLFLSR